jgi:hypothetical protein
MISARDNYRQRMDRATFCLAALLPRDFPERLRNRATAVLGVRRAVREDYGGDLCLFRFDYLTPKQRKALAGDIIALYEACLFDLGRQGDKYDFMYPKDRDIPSNE